MQTAPFLPEVRPAPPALPPAPRTRLSFDRGTLLVDVAHLDDRLRALDVAWDRRTQSFRAPPWRYAELRRELGARPGGVLDHVGTFRPCAPEAWAPLELRDYQRAALIAWQAAGRRGQLVLPTGSGKTRVAMAAMALANVTTLCLVPTRVLLHQWHDALQRQRRGRVGVWGDGQKERAPVTVMTFESAYRNMARLGAAFEMLVVDEAHHFGAGMRDEALEMAVAPLRLGLTATPPSDPLAAQQLDRLLGPVVLRRAVQDLAGTYLAAFDRVVLRVPLDAGERQAYEAARAVFRPHHAAFRAVAPHAAWKDYLAVAQKSPEGRAAVAAWRRSRAIVAYPRAKAETLDALLQQHAGGRVLVFTSDNATAYAIARRNLIMPLTCDIKRTERDDVLERFRRGELRALVSSRVLNEGVDVPEADVAVVVGGTMGEREHIQRVGRVLRPVEGKRATIYELIADETTETFQVDRRGLGLDSA